MSEQQKQKRGPGRPKKERPEGRKDVQIRNMPEVLWRRVMAQSVLEGRPVADLVAEALEQYLERCK